MAKATTKKPPDKASLVAKARRYKAKEQIPLLAHRTGRWGRKVNQSIVYFGRITDSPDFGAGEAMREFHRTIDDIRAGRTPRPKDEAVLTVDDAVNAYLRAKRSAVDAGDMQPRTWADYKATAKRIVRVFGRHRAVEDLRPADFDRLREQIAKTRGPVGIGNEVQRVRTIFRFCFEYELVKHPVAFGPAFKRPSRRVLRLDAKRHGNRMFEAAEIRTLLAAAEQPLRTMILLACNGGLGNSDCGKLPMAALDLGGGWLDYPRPKTGIDRRIPLWAETVDSLRQWLTIRPEPKLPEHEHLVFITARRLAWVKATEDNPVSKEFRKLLDATGLYRPGMGFYSLRRGFRTIADEVKDQSAADFLMGHVDPSMAGVYRQRIGDDRLQAITNHVRRWVFSAERDG